MTKVSGKSVSETDYQAVKKVIVHEIGLRLVCFLSKPFEPDDTLEFYGAKLKSDQAMVVIQHFRFPGSTLQNDEMFEKKKEVKVLP